MSIWKSPVFYFGVILMLVVTAALAAPYVVPWNNYRADLEAYGEKLTGRSVAIGGDIAVKLFPWPQLEARKVEIGNPAGFSDAAFVQADVMRATLSLGGLFNGSLDVEQVEMASPQVNLQRNASGDVNWIFAPKGQVVGRGLLSRVKLDNIQLANGIVSFDDLKNGQSFLVSDLDAVLSAQSILGPWRMKGAAKWHDLPFGLTVTTSAKTPAEPLKFTLKLEPADVAYPQVGLEGAWNGKQFDGALRVDPQEADGSKASSEGTFKPLTMQALVSASTERLSLLNVKITPADRKDSGTLIEGDAVVEFGSEAVARINLKSPRINLDTLAGAEAMQQWRDGGVLSVANSLLANMPAKLVADYALVVSVLTSGGQALNDVRLSGTVQKEAIRVREFTAELPGRSATQFDGVIFPGKDMAQLGGKVAFQSADFRTFLGWLRPAWKPAFDAHWTGSRGRLEISRSTFDWTGRGLSLKDVAFSFDGAAGRADVSQTLGYGPKLDVDVSLKALDVDGLLPNGWSFLRDGGLPALANMVVQKQEAGTEERRFRLAADSVNLNGVAAQAVAIDLRSHPGGLDIKQFDIGNVGGAGLKGGGALIDQGNGPEGELKFDLQAQDPRGFLRLAGLVSGDGLWTEALGQTSIQATVKALPQKSGPELEVVARGSSGPLNMEIVATAREIEKLQGAMLAASGGLNSADSSALARLFGIQDARATGAGDVAFEFKGSMREGFVFSTSVKALDAVAQLSGSANPSLAYYGVNGQFSLKAANGTALVQASGLPVAGGEGEPLDVSAVVTSKDGALDLLALKATGAGRRLSGIAGFSAQGRLQADIETDLLDARDVFGLAFMPMEGTVSDLAASFADPGESGLTGEVFLRPLQFDPVTGNMVKEAVVAIGFERDARQLTISSVGAQSLKLDLTMVPLGAASKFTGSLRWPLELEKVLLAAEGGGVAQGQLVVESEIQASGRSPAAALAALEGKGSYWASDVKLARLTLDGFARGVLGANTPAALTDALNKLSSPPGTLIGQRIGNVSVNNGEATLSPINLEADGVSAVVSAAMDIAANQVRLETTVTLKDRDLPAVSIAYRGEPGQLQTRIGTSALAAKLGYELLSREMAELERLQQVQQALAVKEEAQRKDDEKRFADYQATKAELRKQTRVRRFQQIERERQVAALQAIVEQALKIAPASTRIELLRHARRLEVRRGPPVVLPAQP